MNLKQRLITSRKISIATEFSKAGVAGVTFLLMAQLLGPDEYGRYVQFAAVAGILVPLASAGYASWVQPLAKQGGAADAASAGIAIVLSAGIPLTLASTFITALAFPDQLHKIAAVFFVEMLLFPLWSAITLTFLSDGSLLKYFFTSVSVPTIKLAGTVLALTSFGGGLVAWGATLVPLGIVGLVTTAAVARSRNPLYGLRLARSWLRRGAGFAAVGTASAATDNLDKLMVGWLGGVTAAGNYGVASRFAAYAVIPVRAIALVAYPRYFQLAEEGDFPALRSLMYRTMRKGLWLGFTSAGLASAALYVASLTILKHYQDSVIIGCILALLIPLRAVQYAAGDVTYAIGKSSWRLLVTIVGAVLTATLVGVGAMVANSIGAALGAVLAALLISAMLIGYVENWISKNSGAKRRGRRALLHNNR